MKKQLITLVAMALLLAACRKEEDFALPSESGYTTWNSRAENSTVNSREGWLNLPDCMNLNTDHVLVGVGNLTFGSPSEVRNTSGDLVVEANGEGNSADWGLGRTQLRFSLNRATASVTGSMITYFEASILEQSFNGKASVLPDQTGIQLVVPLFSGQLSTDGGVFELEAGSAQILIPSDPLGQMDVVVFTTGKYCQ